MKHESPRKPPPSPAASPNALPDRAHWTPDRQRFFLTMLMDTGSVASAAAAAGMSRSSAHRLRRRLAGTAFDRAWTRALNLHAARLADPFGSAPPAAPATHERAAPAVNRSQQ